MEKRVLRSRVGKEKENILYQPAKRTRRAISTIECIAQLKSAAAASETKKKIDASSQTSDDCLASTVRQLTGELIAKGNLLLQKDQKYIEMMQMYYLERETLRADNREKTLEIIQLNERIVNLQNMPLVPIEINGKLNLSRNIINCF